MQVQLLFRAVLALLLLTSSSRSFGQDKESQKEALNGLYGDFSPADLTAPTLLGVSSNQVTKPASLKAISGSLIQAAASYPSIGSGVALEVAPILLFPAAKPKFQDQGSIQMAVNAYRKGTIKRGVRNFSISGASVSDDASARVAAGAAIVFFDGADPLRSPYYVSKLAAALSALKEGQSLFILSQNYNATLNNQVDALLQNNKIIASTPAATSSTNALYASLFPMFFALGQIPTTNVGLPTTADLTTSKQRAFDTLRITVNGDNRLDNTQRNALLIGATSLFKNISTMYEHYLMASKTLSEATVVAMKSANDEFEKTNWNATVIQGGAGRVWASPNKVWSNLNHQSTGYFIRGTIRPASSDWQNSANWLERTLYHNVSVVANIRYDNFNNGSSLESHSKSINDSLNSKLWYGGRILIGNSRFRVSFEHAWQQLSYSQAAKNAFIKANKSINESLRSLTTGIEIRLAEKLWLEFAVGATYPKGGFSNQARLLTLSSLKYSFRNEQRFKTF